MFVNKQLCMIYMTLLSFCLHWRCQACVAFYI